MTFAAIGASGFALVGSVAALVVLSLAVSYGISRSLGLPVRLSILISCGNSICGNSAIAAVAPVIGASNDDVASSISFTAVLGVIVVLGLPLLIPLLHLTETQYGILAGMTVYAVPQVLAATVPAGIVSTQIGTLVKLIRVMMLGPVVACIAVFATKPAGRSNAGWFVADTVSFRPCRGSLWRSSCWRHFARCRCCRTQRSSRCGRSANILTIMSMAALGLGVDLRVIGRVGGRITAAVTLSLLFLIVVSLVLVRFVAPA